MKKEAKSDTTLATIPSASVPATPTGTVWGASESASADDLLISKALLIQKMSKLVDDYGATPGEYRDSVTGELLGTNDQPLEVIIFDLRKTWVTFLNGEYHSTFPLTVGNSTLPLEEQTAEGTIRRNKTMNFYCLVVRPDMAAEIPVVLSLSRTGLMTAKKLSTSFARLSRMGKPSASKVIKLTAKKETNDRGTYFIAQAEIGRDTTAEELETAHGWYLQLQASSFKVDESDNLKQQPRTPEPPAFVDGDIPF